MEIKLPEEVLFLIRRLEQKGFAAYAVGGCVRDSLMGRTPSDWDLCTNARPEETKACFPDCAVLETGLKHGTVTLRVNHRSFEITTFRRDGSYLDSRRPEEVSFVSSLQEDLSRRDFTINAMAFHPDAGLVDCWNGREDLKNRRIRCVGNPRLRFQEDALRIMRALRFAASLNFALEEETENALKTEKASLKKIASERIQAEFTKLITGIGMEKILLKFSSVIGVFLPELLLMAGLEQHTPYHCFDVWTHTVKSMAAIPPDPVLRLTMLFHDAGKPDCFFLDGGGIGHFYGHAAKSEEIARLALNRLRYDKETIKMVCTLISFHDTEIVPERRPVKRLLNKLGLSSARLLLQVKRADALAQSALCRPRLALFDKIEAIMEELLQEESCFSLKDLAVNGRDLMELGLSGPAIGETLRFLLNEVLEERIRNEKDALLRLVKQKEAKR